MTLMQLLAAILHWRGHAGAPWAQAHACYRAVRYRLEYGLPFRYRGAVWHQCGPRSMLSHVQRVHVARWVMVFADRH